VEEPPRFGAFHKKVLKRRNVVTGNSPQAERRKRVRQDGAGGGKGAGTPRLRRSSRAGYQAGWHSVDPPRDGIEAYSYGNAVNVVNAVNGMEALLTTTPPDAGKPQRAAAVGVARSDRP
jgi:hypothetical protein